MSDAKGQPIPPVTFSGSPTHDSATRPVCFEVISNLRIRLPSKGQLEGWNRTQEWRRIVSANLAWNSPRLAERSRYEFGSRDLARVAMRQ